MPCCVGWVGEIIAALWEGAAPLAGLGWQRHTEWLVEAPHRQRCVPVGSGWMQSEAALAEPSFSLTDQFPVDGSPCVACGVPGLMNPVPKPAGAASFNAAVPDIPRKRKGSDSDNQ